MWQTDEWIVKNIFEDHLGIACKYKIHPNLVTVVALVLSALIPFMHIYKLYFLVFFSIIIRQLCDTLDGSIARKCEKVSRIGGLLDTIADTIFYFSVFFVIYYMLTQDITIVFLGAFVTVGILMVIHCIIFKINVLYDHSLAKGNENDSFSKSTISFIFNNSMILAILLAVIYVIYFGIHSKIGAKSPKRGHRKY